MNDDDPQGKRTREDSIQEEIDELRQEEKRLEEEKAMWMKRAEAAQNTEDARLFWSIHDSTTWSLKSVNKRLEILHERRLLLKKEKYERDQKQLKEEEVVDLVFQDFNLKDKGPSFVISCKRNTDFLEQARAKVLEQRALEQAPVKDNEVVSFYCFFRGVNGRCEFTISDVVWKGTPSSCIYYSIGPKPELFVEKMIRLERQLNAIRNGLGETRNQLGETRNQLGETQNQLGETRNQLGETRKQLCETQNEFIVPRQLPSMQNDLTKLQEVVNKHELRILRLEAPNSYERNRIGYFMEGKDLYVDQVEKIFSLPAVFDDNALRTCCGKVRSPNQKGMQELFADMLPILSPSSTFCDCRAPNGISFAGRRHDIALVLFAEHVRSMENVVLPIKLKESIAREADRCEVVLQLLDRMVYIFDAQRDRKVCWGLAFDATHVVFVRAFRDKSFEVTPALQLFGDQGHLKLLAGFLQSDASSHGYVAVPMPVLWGAPCVSLLAQRESGAVFALSDAKKVAKAGRSKDSVEAERDMMTWICESAPGLVCPEVFPCELSTGNATWPYGFQMTHLEVVCVSCEADVARVAGDVFWCLAVLHELGVVHNDVKPPNMLSAETQGRAFLCDFGHAVRWRPGNDMLDVRGATESFGVVETAFVNSATSMYACDMEGLYWSVMALWLQVVDKRSSWRPETVVHRVENMLLCGGEGLIREYGKNRLKRVLPQDQFLRTYLHEQAKDRMLWEPNQLIDKYLSISNCSEDEWLAQVQRLEAETQVFPCPPRVLLWFRARRMGSVQ